MRSKHTPGQGLGQADVIRSSHDPSRERRALEAWRKRYSLASRPERLRQERPGAHALLVEHIRRWGYEVAPGLCARCGGAGHLDDILCPFCEGTGVR